MTERAGDRSVVASGLQHIGTFRFWYDTSSWEWSDEVARLHGYQPGEVVPTTELLSQHKHPDDRQRFEGLVAEMLTCRTPFSSRHRIIDKQGVEHRVAVVAQTFLDADGNPVGSEGFYLDLSEFEDSSVNRRVDDHIQCFRENSAVIEQAKGMLMFVYGVNAERAFDVLRWRSQHENVKVQALCKSIMDRSTHVRVAESIRQQIDQVILSSPGR